MKRYWPLAALAIGCLLLAFGLLSLLRPAPQSSAQGLPAPISIISPQTGAPPPGTAPVSLRRVRLPELGIDLPITEGDGRNAPLYQAAHYPGMKWPGEGGRSLIYAHARAGMFEPLFRAKVGQQVEVDRPDKPPLRYVIRQYYPRWPNTDTVWLRPTDHEQLILLTCTTYNPNDPRIVVVAEPAPAS
ncbi:MAG: sortase [Candidatus Dormibacteraeota bacterium]|nr:sortase [Candidatus Dormibacteraeota bacterium]